MIDQAAADRIAEILVVECGADAKLLEDWGFWRYVMSEDPNRFPIEFRFVGRLGFGGKFRIHHGRMYVDCYSEDENPTRLRMIRRANQRLETLRQELARVSA